MRRRDLLAAILGLVGLTVMFGAAVRAFLATPQLQPGKVEAREVVIDNAGLLSPETLAFLNRRIENLRAKRFRGVWVATVETDQKKPNWPALARAVAPDEIRNGNPSSMREHGANEILGVYIFIGVRAGIDAHAFAYAGERSGIDKKGLARIRAALTPAFMDGRYGVALSAAVEEASRVFSEIQKNRPSLSNSSTSTD